jgi:hypothetical protein
MDVLKMIADRLVTMGLAPFRWIALTPLLGVVIRIMGFALLTLPVTLILSMIVFAAWLYKDPAAKDAIWNWGREHREWLEWLNRKIAYMIGCPIGTTMSGNAYREERRDKIFGKFFRPKIDGLFYWGIKQLSHCQKAYDKDLAYIKANGLPTPS